MTTLVAVDANNADWWARGIGATGLAVAAVSAVVNVLTYRRGRRRTTAEARQGVMASGDSQFDIAYVTVANHGRAIGVQSIDFVPPNPIGSFSTTSPYVDLNPVMFDALRRGPTLPGFPTMGFDSPSLPHTLGDGEARTWSYRISQNDHTVIEEPKRVEFHAVVHLSDGSSIESNPVWLRLTAFPVRP